MNNPTAYLKWIQPWYVEVVRRFLHKHGHGDKTKSLDEDVKYLHKQAQYLDRPISVSFLGSSGVGKSTLINAIVAGSDCVVPSGGVGPLTARELRIEYGAEPQLTGIYHRSSQIWKLLFALSQMFPGELASKGVNLARDFERSLQDADRFEIESTNSLETNQGLSKAESYRKLATLIVAGDQDAEVPLPYVVDCLREAIGKKREFGTRTRDSDLLRVAYLQKLFASENADSPAGFQCGARDPTFACSIDNHATGYLAPLVSELSIKWNSPLLSSGVQLVDLPGLGVAGDVYRQVTDEWIRQKSQIVVLVVDSRGIRESDADLLRSSGFLTRFLHSADDPMADPVSLVVTVVQIDNIADARRHQDKPRLKTKLEHFRDIQNEAKEKLAGQIRDRLRDAWLEGADAAAKDTKLAIINRIANETPIYPLSAIQYRNLLANDDDSPAFIANITDSGVPQFVDGLKRSANTLQQERLRRFSDRAELFDAEVRSVLRVIHARLADANATSEQAKKLKEDLDRFLPPLREEQRARQGQFRSYLKDVLPSRIETLVADARISATKDLRTYLRKLKDVHWATLRAAIRRGGTYQGSRHIEIPRDFAQALEEPVAEIWGTAILKEVRQQTKKFADDLQQLVKQLVDWCRNHSSILTQEVVDAQLESMRVDTRKLTTVGKEMVDELRDSVRMRLLKAIEEPIRRKCQNFVRRNADVGAGVKFRMHELLDDLLDESLDTAVPAAKQILMENYQDVEGEIRKAFSHYHDPLKVVVETFLEKYKAREDDAELKRRRAVLSELSDVLAKAPNAE